MHPNVYKSAPRESFHPFNEPLRCFLSDVGCNFAATATKGREERLLKSIKGVRKLGEEEGGFSMNRVRIMWDIVPFAQSKRRAKMEKETGSNYKSNSLFILPRMKLRKSN